MVDPEEDPEGFQVALVLERAAWRIAATRQHSEAGELVLASVAATISAELSHLSVEAQAEAARKALVVLAQSQFDAAANALAALLLAGQNRLVAEDVLGGGNVVKLIWAPVVAKLSTEFRSVGRTPAEEEAMASLARREMEAKLDQMAAKLNRMAAELAKMAGRTRKPPADA
jgi:hypothetical protein